MQYWIVATRMVHDSTQEEKTTRASDKFEKLNAHSKSEFNTSGSDISVNCQVRDLPLLEVLPKTSPFSKMLKYSSGREHCNHFQWVLILALRLTL